MRCRNGLRREDVFLLLMMLAEASENNRDGASSLDLSMLIEPEPPRSPSRRPERRPVGGEAEAGTPAGV